MKPILRILPIVIVLVLLACLWVAYFHNEGLLAHTPGWTHGMLKHLGQHKDEAPPEEEDPDNTKNEIPVHLGKVTTATLHRYIDGYGTVVPRLPREGEPSANATVASAVAGVVSRITAHVGQQLKAGDVLITLDDRLAKSAEDQAQAAVAEAKAGLALINANPRPEQLQIAQLAVEKSQGALEFAQKAYDRQKLLAADQSAPAKALEQATLDLASAKNDLASAKKQLDLLNAAPQAEAVAQETAKVTAAEAALAAAKIQRQLLTITSPIDGTVTDLPVTPGESIDVSKTVAQIVAMDRLMVDVDVPAEQLPTQAEGLAAQIFRSTASPDDPGITAKITFVSPQVEAKNGSVMLGIDLPPDAGLRPGLTARVRIIAQEHKDVLAVPREAVVTDENGDASVAVVSDINDTKTPEGTAKSATATKRTVKSGLEENGLIEITTDLKEGTPVVTQGAFGLRTTERSLQQTRVRVVE